MEEENLLLRILDKVEDPTNLSLALLQKITGNFSEERKIGHGGFGEVYKGVLGEKIVAVKRIHINENTVDDKLFRREFASLWNTNHRNVVRFLGFCSNTYQKKIEEAGSKDVNLANIKERLLCFEYISNGSLDKHITDELRGLEWETRYEIITGICKGLRYLHEEKNIIHMDLKPANILLDHQDEKYMVSKITDFGLSRPNKYSHTVGQRYGTRAYLAPEYGEGSKTTPACDIYSLGAIIREIVTGCTKVPDQDNVLRRWRHRWNKPPTPLQYQRVTRCMEIAVRCRELKPEARPSISEIISFLSESESMGGHTRQESTYLDDDMLGIEPFELHYTFELNKEVSWLVKLTNRTTACFAFKIERPSKQYTIWPDQGVLTPERKECLVQITVGAPQVTQNGDKFTVWSTKVSEGLTVEHITEHTFHEEAGKVVDEVDLMVVYEPTKPQQNFRSREDTNMPAEEVPEAKKRKIVEHSSRKGKNKPCSSENAESDISSTAQGQCTEQTVQCNLHTLQSFSRNYCTSRRYLGEESHRAVDVSRGAMGSLLDKLGKLLTGDYSLDPSIKKDIESFSDDLRKMHQDLLKLENVDGAKDWVDEVRELSYHIEDMVDRFLVYVVPDSGRSGFKELKHEGLKLLVNGIPTHHQIDNVTSYIKDKVQAVADWQKKYSINVNNVVANSIDKAAIYPRMNVYTNKEHLIGIEVPRDEVIGLFEEGGDVDKQELRIVSIVGMGGLGKTTLAKVVYEEYKGYTHKAFVPVGQNPDPITVLKKIIRACQGREYIPAKLEQLDVGQLRDELHDFLKDKRYFIVIDDLWCCELWDTINFAFPRDKCGSRVITTTRIPEVVYRESWRVENKVYRIKQLGDEDSRSLFFRRSNFTPIKEEISKDILKKCGGLPLAINCIASHLALHPSESSWEHVRKSLGAIKGNDIEKMKQILDLSYIHLPNHLKTCLLHVCMYPEDRKIKKNGLLRQWVAEGFVSTNGGQDAEDVAEEYFRALIDMSMIEPWKIDYYNNEVLSCRVHDIVLDLMRSKSSELNFAHVIDGLKDVLGPRGEIRRASVQNNDKEDSSVLETIKGSLSHARSVLLYRRLLFSDFMKHKYVRVLHLEDKVYSKEPIDLTGISSLFFLRYLKIEIQKYSDGELKLPAQIGQLQQLETIDIRGGKLENYPSDIVTLRWLSLLKYSTYPGIALPCGIERLKSLRTLEGVCLSQSSVESIKGLGELTNLRNLGIISEWYTTNEELDVHMNALHSTISRLSSSLRIFTLKAELPRHDMSRWSRTLFPEGSRIGKLHLSKCRFQRCPEWIGQLPELYSLSIEVREVANGASIVARLPSLSYFFLEIDRYEKEEKEESVVISGSSGAFKSLKHLIFHCRKASLTFEEGALPKLEKLDMQFIHHRNDRFLPAVGIEHLPAPTLKEITFAVWTDGDETNWECMVDSEDWECMVDSEDDDPDDYFGSRQYRNNLAKQLRMLSYLLKRAFKEHHPGATIDINFEDHNYNDTSDDEAECCNEEAVQGALMQMCLPRSRQLYRLTSVQLSTLINILYTEDLAVGSEGWQSEGTEDLESSELPFYLEPRSELSGQATDL
ncbi:unnamed protein product [Alopecurus aequalis]